MNRWFIFAALACLLSGSSASASMIYSNGPINGDIAAFDVNVGWGYAVSNSFSVPTTSTITGVTFGVWAYQGDPPLTVQWGISSSPDFGSSLGGGVDVPVTNSLVCSAFDPSASYTACSPGILVSGGFFAENLYYSSFSVPNIVLGAGTYYLTLQKGTMLESYDEIGWDINNGPSAAFDSGLPGNGSVANLVGPGTNSETFAILGTTPEPGSFILLGGGMLLLAAGWRRKSRNE